LFWAADYITISFLINNLPKGSNAFYYFIDRTAMNKIVSDEEWVEARKVLFKKEKLYFNVAIFAALAVMILAAAPSI
jgi:hypothetical protein